MSKDRLEEERRSAGSHNQRRKFANEIREWLLARTRNISYGLSTIGGSVVVGPWFLPDVRMALRVDCLSLIESRLWKASMER